MSRIMKISSQNVIAGFDDSYRLLSTEFWYPISDEIFNYCMKHNGGCYLKMSDDLKERLNEFNKKRSTIDFASLKEELPSVLTLDDLTLELPVDMDYVRSHQQDKNRGWMNGYISSGIMYRIDGKRVNFSYNASDELHYMEILNLINSGVYTEKVLVQTHDVVSGENLYLSVDRDTFMKIYKRLLYNKFYNIFYCEELNKYVMTLDSKPVIDKLSYLTPLPQEYNDRINEKIHSVFGNYFDEVEEQ